MINEPWYAVKCLFLHKDLKRRNGMHHYEERILLVKANHFDEAFKKAEKEAKEYCNDLGDEVECLNFSNAYHIGESEIKDGTEIYSLITKSLLNKTDYINKHYNTDDELKEKKN